MLRVAFLGLGAMGTPMARRLLAAGFPLTVWNRRADKAKGLAEAGATVAGTPREAAAAADVVGTMLTDPRAVESVATGADGLLAGLSPGNVWLDFSTVTPDASRRFAALAKKRGADFCDVPVAGSIKPAAEGTLTILAGGEAEPLARVRPVLEAVSKAVEHLGPVGHGSAMKLVNNLMFGTGLAAFGEALGLAARLGLDRSRTAAWLLATPAIAPYVKAKWEFLEAGGRPAQFGLALMEKDLRPPAVEGARSEFERADAGGAGAEDFSHVILAVERRLARPQ